ncbi:MAG: hypothetical protein Q7W13_16365 [Bacteroidia bacterium]|nr:hypothetical protein [Bacteroidia bacterium]
MLPFHQLEDYNHHLQCAAQALNKMQIKIATMKRNPAIPLAKRKENEAAYYALREFVGISERTLNDLIKGNGELANEQFSKGYLKEKKDKRESAMGGIPNCYLDREGYRAYHELEVKNKWGNLY